MNLYSEILTFTSEDFDNIKANLKLAFDTRATKENGAPLVEKAVPEKDFAASIDTASKVVEKIAASAPLTLTKEASDIFKTATYAWGGYVANQFKDNSMKDRAKATEHAQNYANRVVKALTLKI